MVRYPAILVSLVACMTAMQASAAGLTVTQNKKAFSEKEVTIKAGESITFVNDDEVTHNVYSRSKANKFDSGAQTPGSSMTQLFASPGSVKVRCAIHPRMKLTVNVE